MIVTIVIALLVVAGVSSWFVDRRRRRRNQVLDDQGLVRAEDVSQVGDTHTSAGNEVGIAEALLRGGRHGSSGLG
jgi:hypothetical protein